MKKEVLEYESDAKDWLFQCDKMKRDLENKTNVGDQKVGWRI